MAKARQIFFRIFYSTSFTIVFLLLIAFICVSLADILYQSYHRQRLIDIFLVSGVYVVTGLLSVLTYASRLFTNRSVLKDIPKTYIPIERDDLPTKRTWTFISDTLAKSAVVAYQTRPRSKKIEDEFHTASERIAAILNPGSGRTQDGIVLQADWGLIEHPGWSSPAAPDLPNLEYATVVAELMDLIEAKAVSLAPVDPLATPATDGGPVPDSRVIQLLTRPPNSGMRRYLAQLMEWEVVQDNEITTSFIKLYEHARFGSEPLSGAEFHSLMCMFAEILRSMKRIDPELVNVDDQEAFSDHEDADDIQLNHQLHHPSNTATGASVLRRSDTASTFSSANSDDGSVLHPPPPPQQQQILPPRRVSEDSVPSNATDEEEDSRVLYTTSSSIRRPTATPRRSSRNTVPNRRFVSSNSETSRSRPRTQIPLQQQSQTSLVSSRSGRSGYSNNGSVVVRLNEDDDGGEGVLPYTIEITQVPVVVADH